MNRRAFSLGLLGATSAFAVTHTAVAQTRNATAVPAAEYLTLALRGGQFLEETARTGYEKTSDHPTLKKFSRAEVVEQVGLAGKLNSSAASMGIISAGSPRLPMAPGTAAPGGGVVGAVTGVPLAVAGAGLGVAGTGLGLVGGAVGLQGGPGTMTSDGQKAEIIIQLRAMPAGPAFDMRFVDVQLTGHREARMIHGAYARNGDDPELRRIARGALPLIDLHISMLTRFQAEMGQS